MWVLSFYRLYGSIAVSLCCYLFLIQNIAISLLVLIAVRTSWYYIEHFLESRKIDRLFKEHRTAFKQEFGPYGIRIVNLAESQPHTKRSLAEVFTNNILELKKTVEQLEVMNTLFDAGMRPDGDDYLLHDLKLKYGKKRIEKS